MDKYLLIVMQQERLIKAFDSLCVPQIGSSIRVTPMTNYAKVVDVCIDYRMVDNHRDSERGKEIVYVFIE